MKKTIFAILTVIMCVCFSGCTSNYQARVLGGNMVINLEPGQKLIMATWKSNASLWYLTEPAEPGYTPKTKVLQENSRYGIVEGKVTFIER